MYIITSNTSSDIAINVIQNGENKVVHLTKKFSTTTSDKLTDSIIYFDSKNIAKYAEVGTVQEAKENHHRGRKSNQVVEPPKPEEETTKSDEDKKSDEGGK